MVTSYKAFNRQNESVQKYFVRKLPGLGSLSYIKRLNAVKLVPLEVRRLHSDLILCYKIVYNLVDIPFNVFFAKDTSCRVNRSTNPNKLYMYFSRTDVLSFCFGRRVICVWNHLPLEITSLPNVNAFKTALHSVNFIKFLRGRL